VPAGTTYVAEGENSRISQFDPSGNFVRAWGEDVVSSGQDQSYERQRITVDATGGTFTLTTVSATGGGHLTSGSNQITEFAASSGSVHVGDSITASGGLPPGTTVTGVGPGTLQLSATATENADPTFVTSETSSNIAATAPALALEAAINALPAIAVGGGSVSVGGGPGNAGGTTPYFVLFDGGPLAAHEYSVLDAADGSPPLSGGAATAAAGRTSRGGSGFEVCNANPPSNDICQGGSGGSYSDVAVDQATGKVYSIRFGHVLEFSPTGSLIRSFGQDVVKSGPDNVTPASAVQSIDVPAGVTGGEFTLTFGGKTTGPIAYNAAAGSVEAELEALASIGAGNVTVSGGPGATAAYTVTFSGALANNPEPLIGVDSTNLVGDVASVSNTTTGATGFEICGPSDSCRDFEAIAGSSAGAFKYSPPPSLVIAPPGAPNEGDVVAADPGNRRVQEFSSSGAFVRAFGFDVVSAGPDDNGTSSFEECKVGDACQSATGGEAIGQFGAETPNGVAEDSAGAIYAVESGNNFRIQKFTPQAGPPSLSPTIFGVSGAPNGTSAANAPTNVAIGASGHVFVAKAFPAGATGTCPDGSPSASERRVQELTADGLSLVDTHMTCNGITPTSGLAADPNSGTLYVSVPETNPFKMAHRVYLLGPTGPPSVTLNLISEETSTGAKVTGTVNPNASTAYPNPPTTSYHLEYKLSSSPTWIRYAPDVSVGSGVSGAPVSVFLNGLIPNRSYEARLVVNKQFGEGVAITPPQAFSTLPAAPSIDTFFSSGVTATSADLHVVVNSFGEDATYRFEYGTTTGYGNTAPTPDGEISAGPSAQERIVHITGLEGSTYHFRVTAENNAGTTTTGDQTFTFYPPDCPNVHLRQQTGASFLPDCRAYELVSPANAGNVILLSSAPFAPYASSPPRFAYSGNLGAVTGSGEPQGYGSDLYVATRHNDGWFTRYVGVPGNQGNLTGGPPLVNRFSPLAGAAGSFTDLSLSKILDWDRGQQGAFCCGHEGSYAGYLWDSTGSSLGRLPTNAAGIANAEKDITEGGFVGDVQPSPNFSHYFFSSRNIAFAQGGLTNVPGSAYDDNLVTGEVSVISKTSQGVDIPQDSGDATEFIEFPGVSTDGSHILMSTKASGEGIHLYMSVDDAPSYDVSRGQDGLNHGVGFLGMTADGATVFFTSKEQLTSDDHDSSVDLFMWKEKPSPSVTRISTGSAGAGDTDTCSAAWISGCGVAGLDLTARSDNTIAAESGDVYFYSPEQLDSGKGTPGERNLYVYWGGQAHYVTTFVGDGKVSRMQVAPDGGHMAFVTTSQLTPYKNTDPSGICNPESLSMGTPATGPDCLEMYTYEPSSGTIICVSCTPDGSPPTSDVEASHNGLFMADDGRTAFATSDSLVQQDTNGLIDVYEFVDNRPQLISSGTAADNGTRFENRGLAGLSADGVDLYFMTTETFVGQDLNGPFMKVYDARTGGGFPFSPPPSPCGAADECHGAGNSPPERGTAGTSASLGSGGNLGAVHRHHTRKRHGHHRKHRGAAKHTHHRRG
jgi:hypothetical protein